MNGMCPQSTEAKREKGGLVQKVASRQAFMSLLRAKNELVLGFEGAVLAKRHFAYWKETEGLEKPQASYKPYHGATDRTWIGPEFNVANATRYVNAHNCSKLGSNCQISTAKTKEKNHESPSARMPGRLSIGSAMEPDLKARRQHRRLTILYPVTP